MKKKLRKELDLLWAMNRALETRNVELANLINHNAVSARAYAKELSLKNITLIRDTIEAVDRVSNEVRAISEDINADKKDESE